LRRPAERQIRAFGMMRSEGEMMNAFTRPPVFPSIVKQSLVSTNSHYLIPISGGVRQSQVYSNKGKWAYRNDATRLFSESQLSKSITIDL